MARPGCRAAAVVGAAVAATLTPLAVATPVGAHPGHDPSVWSGLTHPVGGVDHLVAMVVVGVLAAVGAGVAGPAGATGSERPRPGSASLLPVAFVSAMVVGALLGLAGIGLPGREAAVALSVSLLGLALVLAVAVPGPGRDAVALGTLLLVVAAGAVHGHAHGDELPVGVRPLVWVVGFVTATAVLHAAGWGIGRAVRRRPAVPVALGSAAACAGALLVLAPA